MQETDVILVFSTFPDPEKAREITRILVEENLAACGNIITTVESIYRWKGTVEEATESMVIFKTTAACYAKMQTRLKTLHPYEVPEIIQISAQDGLPAYFQWVRENVRESSPR